MTKLLLGQACFFEHWCLMEYRKKKEMPCYSLLSSSRSSPSPNTRLSAAIETFLSFLSSLVAKSPATIIPLPVSEIPSSSNSSPVSSEYAYLHKPNSIQFSQRPKWFKPMIDEVLIIITEKITRKNILCDKKFNNCQHVKHILGHIQVKLQGLQCVLHECLMYLPKGIAF